MVFIFQQSQNKDTMALQLKLNELIASQKEASNRLIDIEDLTSDELEVLKKFYLELAILLKRHSCIHNSHSIDEAETIHRNNKQNRFFQEHAVCTIGKSEIPNEETIPHFLVD